MFQNRSLNNRINKLQEKVLQLVYKDKASSSDEKREYFKVHQKNILKMATEMYKVKNKIAPKLMCGLFEKTENLKKKLKFTEWSFIQNI